MNLRPYEAIPTPTTIQGRLEISPSRYLALFLSSGTCRTSQRSSVTSVHTHTLVWEIVPLKTLYKEAIVEGSTQLREAQGYSRGEITHRIWSCLASCSFILTL